MSADLRTASTTFLFGIAFLGFSEITWDFFFISGIISMAVGLLYLAAAFSILMEHSQKINVIKEIFDKLLRKNNKD